MENGNEQQRLLLEDVSTLFLNSSFENEFFNSTEPFFRGLTNETMGNCTQTKLSGPLDDMIVFWTTLVLYGIVFTVGLIGNSLVIYVVLRYSKMQTVTNFYILNMAIADETFLIGLPFLMITYLYRSWPFGYAMCKIYMTLTSVNQFTSSMLLVVMSADRYLAVCHPINATRLRTPMISKIVALTAWTISALLIVPVFMYTNTLTRGETVTCNIIWPQTQLLDGVTAFTLYTFLMSFAVPACLIMTFYFLVIRKLKTVGPRKKSEEKKRSHRKVTNLVLTVITVYVLCWLPYWALQIQIIVVEPGASLGKLFLKLNLVSAVLSYSNSALNPVLYAFLSENFRKSFIKACACAKRNEVNNLLNVEHSMLSRRRSERLARTRSINQSTTRELLIDNKVANNTNCVSVISTTMLPLESVLPTEISAD